MASGGDTEKVPDTNLTVGALGSVLELVSRFGVPTVLSVVLVGYLLWQSMQMSQRQTELMQRVSSSQELITHTLDRLATQLDRMEARQTGGGASLVPIR